MAFDNYKANFGNPAYEGPKVSANGKAGEIFSGGRRGPSQMANPNTVDPGSGMKGQATETAAKTAAEAERDVANTYGDAQRDVAKENAGAYMYGANKAAEGQIGAAAFGAQGQIGAANAYAGAQNNATNAQFNLGQQQIGYNYSALKAQERQQQAANTMGYVKMGLGFLGGILG